MKKIIAFSDSHGDDDVLIEIIEKETDAVAFFHAGDGWEEGKRLQRLYPEKNIFVVAGNCDWGHSYQKELETLLGETRIFLTHGHLYRVKTSLHDLAVEGRKRQADLVIYGHTHRKQESQVGDLMLVNPGSCNRQGRTSPSYAQIYLKKGERSVVFVDL